MRGWREVPDSFVFDNFGVTPDKWQSKVLKAFVRGDVKRLRIAMAACAGPGKSAAIAWCVWIFISCYGDETDKPKGYAISSTWDTLADTLWPEVAKWRSLSPFLMETFEWTKSRIYCRAHPETWFVAARSFSKNANEEEQGRTLSGLHSKYIAYFIDESGDIPISVLKSAEQGLSNCVFGRIVTAGNPTSNTGILYFAVEEDFENWTVIRITGDPDDPERSPRIDIDQARDMIEKYGRDDSWVMSFILGKFPKGGINTLLGPEEVREAIKRGQASDLTKVLYEHSQKRLGIDVAMYGDDKTIIFPRQGMRAFMPVEMRDTATEGEAPSMIAARVIEAKNTWGSELEFVDCGGGYGEGVVNYLRDAGADPIRVVGAKKASRSSRYVNKRTEMYFKMRDWIRAGGILPNDTDLIKELSTPTYGLKGGKIALEAKALIKARIKRSPDKADALGMTFYMEDVASGVMSEIPQLDLIHDQQSSDWDPFV